MKIRKVVVAVALGVVGLVGPMGCSRAVRDGVSIGVTDGLSDGLAQVISELVASLTGSGE